MKIPRWLELLFLAVIDKFYALLPQKQPSAYRFRQAKIIAHRGVCHRFLENTLPAFDEAVKAGIWGIEIDIRWTKDLIPVVHHDASCWRVFHQKIAISEVSALTLQLQQPAIPTLQQVVERYGKKIHLMIELKTLDNSQRQNAILKTLLAPLTPKQDYSIISLNLEILRQISFAPKTACYAIALLNVRQCSKFVIKQGYGGLLGHYFFINDKVIAQHRHGQQTVGVGFISSKSSLFRELNRGVHWIYTNDPLQMQKLISSQ